jgi:hypothetical protein
MLHHTSSPCRGIRGILDLNRPTCLAPLSATNSDLYTYMYVCVCVCLCGVCALTATYTPVCVCVCVCVWESQRPERERHEQRKLLQTPSRTHGARTQLCRYPPARRRPKHDLPSCLPAVCCRQHGQQWGTGSVVSRHRRGCRFPCPPTLPTDWPCGRRSTGRNSQQSVP